MVSMRRLVPFVGIVLISMTFSTMMISQSALSHSQSALKVPRSDSETARDQKAKHQSLERPVAGPEHCSETAYTLTACWEHVDWGIKRPMPLPVNGTTRCVTFEAPHAAERDMEYCAFPAGVQIHPFGMKAKRSLNRVAADGQFHDPRFTLRPKHVAYECSANASSSNGNTPEGFRCGVPRKTCGRRFDAETLLLSRRYDHNPFFMTSIVLNAWLMDKPDAQIIMLDDAGKQPLDDLFRKILSPKHPILYADTMRNVTWCFEKPLWTVPTEFTGPLMNRLNSPQISQPCRESKLIQDFSHQVHSVYPNVARSDNRTTVTFVGRRNYNKRRLGRVWKNEPAVVKALQEARLDLYVRLVYYEDISIEEQIHIDRTTDIMVGMHGAGMLHVLFLPDNAHVVEVFPRTRRRWGHRNIAQYRGFTYDDYRCGNDGDNDVKQISVANWMLYWNRRFPVGRFDTSNKSSIFRENQPCPEDLNPLEGRVKNFRRGKE